MDTFGKFREIYEKRHEYAKDWKKRTGRKVFGYFCTYAPEEIIHAAGILPVRILGAHEPQDVTEPHIYAMYCPLSRDILAQGLKGRYDYLDGIVYPHSCIHMRQAFAAWKTHVPVPFSYYLFVPAKVQSPRAKDMLVSELAEFKKSLEKFTGNTISNKALDQAIEVYNKNRHLMRQIYDLRKADNPPLTGVEAILMVVASQFSDKEEHNRLLEQALKELPQRKPRETGKRLMMVGSEDDDIEFMEGVEQWGATIVIDDHCTGGRYFWNEVVPDKDRLAAIANRYLERPPCATKDLEERIRFPHILKLAKDWKVDGVLTVQQKFCDPHEFDIPPLQRLLEKNGIPSYFLEFDVTVPVGQFRTRVEAFLETLEFELI